MSHEIYPRSLEEGPSSLLATSSQSDLGAAQAEVGANHFYRIRRQTLIDANIGYHGNSEFISDRNAQSAWYQNPVTARAQKAVIQDYGSVERRYGGKLLTSHPFGTADRIAEACKNPVIKRKLDELGVSDMLMIVTELLHDHAESKVMQAYKLAKTKAEPLAFDVDVFNQGLRKLWQPSLLPQFNELEFIVDHVWWMTDQPELNGVKLSGRHRIIEQMKKCFPNVKDTNFRVMAGLRTPYDRPIYFISETDTNIREEDCRITLCKQLFRFHDKIDNLERDVTQRRNFNAYREECEKSGIAMPTDIDLLRKIGLPDADVREAYDQALMKSYVLLFPEIPEEDKARYRQGLKYLADEVTSLESKASFNADGSSLIGPVVKVIKLDNDGPGPGRNSGAESPPPRALRHYSWA